MNLEKTARELRAFGHRILEAAKALESSAKPAPGRILSKEARQRIGDAQRKRWAKVRKKAA